ncbi:MAG TPA: methylmalonyl-CoA mutase subunit beta [Xanthobacteraceae bacterium]|jgi:methylmalonyl-CoA mutase|nr:methylmalonyl-CoA mutase subunit beta [Xanthobacteraceae bacterium]
MTTAETLSLAGDFAPATHADWRKLVDAVLKGAPFEKLESKTYDGLTIEPLYERDSSAHSVSGRAPGRPWTILQRVDHPDPAAANAQALTDLENGATGLILIFAESISANGFGLEPSVAALARVLDGIDLAAGIALDLNLSPSSRHIVGDLADLVKRKGLAPATVDIRFSINPIGGFAACGTSPRRWPDMAPYFAKMVGGLAGDGFRGPFAVADGRVIHNAGGSDVQELAFALASAVTYLRALETGGITLDRARDAIYFRLSADADQFLTMAKFRAARKLWARVETACGLAPKPVMVTAETAWRMMTRRDAYVNMLRNAIAVTAAGLGGADAVTVLPHTAPLGLPDAFARRAARNTQLLLLEESNLARVGDPAAGSGALEAVTEQLCNAAWSQFQEIEKAGGAWAALESEMVQKNAASVLAERRKAIARGKDVLTGTNAYPDIAETKPAVLDIAPQPSKKNGAAAVAVSAEPLPRIRLAEPFESLRDRSDAILAKTGARPKVFLANLGKLSDFTARATFAKGFFEAGGIAALSNDSFAGLDDMIAAFKASGAAIACLCSSDDVYARDAATAAKALAPLTKHLYLAGRPAEQDALKAAGVGTFIYAGSDMVAVLQETHTYFSDPQN